MNDPNLHATRLANLLDVPPDGGPALPLAPRDCSNEEFPLIAGFEVRERLGAGAGGSVYLALDLRHDCAPVAIKILHSQYVANDLFREQFRREYELLSHLNHRNIVRVFSDGESPRPWFSMAYLPGPKLDEHLRKAQPARDAAKLTLSLAAALTHAHSRGVYHRDIKPANVILDEIDDEPVLVDLGLAAKSGISGSLTGAVVGGSDNYVPPEAIGKGAVTADPIRWDIYSLGSFLFRAWTGRDPLGDESLPPHSRDLANIVRRCRATLPELRYGRMAEVFDDLQRFLAGKPTSVRKFPGLPSLYLAARHPKWTAAMALGLIALTAACAIGYAKHAENQEYVRLQQIADQQHETDEAERQKAEAERRKAEAERAGNHIREIITHAEALGAFQTDEVRKARVLERVRKDLVELEAAWNQEPNRAGELADLYRRCGLIAFKLGDWGGAEGDYDVARRWAEQALAGDRENPAERLRMAKVLREWGVTRVVRGEQDKARAAWGRARELIAPVAATGTDYRFTLAQIQMVWANTVTEQEQLDRYADAETLIEGLLRDSTGDPKVRFTLAEILNNRAHLAQSGKLDKKAEDCRRAVAIRRELVAELPGRPEQMAYLAASLNHLGNTLLRQSPPQFAEAENAYNEAIALYESLVQVLPGVVSNRKELTEVQFNMKQLTRMRSQLREGSGID